MSWNWSWEKTREIVIKNVAVVEPLERKIKGLETRVLQLECSHPEVEFYFNGIWGEVKYIKKCKRCLKTLTETSDKKIWLEEQAEDLLKKHSDIQKKIDEL